MKCRLIVKVIRFLLVFFSLDSYFLPDWLPFFRQGSNGKRYFAKRQTRLPNPKWLWSLVIRKQAEQENKVSDQFAQFSDRRSAAIRRSANYSCRGSNGHKQKNSKQIPYKVISIRETSLFTKLKIEWAHRKRSAAFQGIKSFWSERVRKFYMGMCLLLALFLLKRSLYSIRRLARNEKRVYREFCNDFYLSMN